MTMEKNKKKLVIIGIDGGNFDVMNPFIEKGLMPNLAKMKKRAVLESVIPPTTAVAWASFSTGNYPGKTEIYDFTIVDDNSWNIDFIDRTRLRGKPLWIYLSEAGVKPCYVNIPLTYPVDKIDGIIVSGIETPSTMCNYTNPPELKKELNEIGYKIDVSGLKDKREDLVEEGLDNFNKRLKAVELLLKKDFDFFIVLFRESDIMKHYAWGKKEVEDVYGRLDKLIGELKANPNYEVIAMSDHGFEKIDYAFNANAWLEKNGYLTLTLKRNWLQTFGITRKRVYRIIEKLKLNFLIRMIPRKLAQKVPEEKIGFEQAITTGVVDMSKTKAIAKRALKTAQIFLNSEKRGGIVKKEEEESLKQEIKEKLLKFFEEKKIKVIVKTKEELYGKNVNYAPDVTLYFEEKGYDTFNIFTADKTFFIPPIESQDAEHNLHGVIFTDLDLNLENPAIVDLAPTILDYFKIKYNKNDFDGKSLLRHD